MTALIAERRDPLSQRRRLAVQADWIAAHSRATELGRRARRAYLDRAQIRNLQRVAETALAVSTLTDYVKTMIGKHPLWRREAFGLMLLEELERLEGRVDGEAGQPHDDYRDLCRLYVRQVAASYLYSIAVDTAAPRPAPAAPARPVAPPREPTRPPRPRGQRGAQRPAAAASAPTDDTVAPAPEDAAGVQATVDQAPEDEAGGLDAVVASGVQAVAEHAEEPTEEQESSAPIEPEAVTDASPDASVTSIEEPALPIPAAGNDAPGDDAAAPDRGQRPPEEEHA